MVDLPLLARIPASSGKELGQQSQQKDPHQDGHVRNQHGRVTHRNPGPFNREKSV
jgi:hypothetical protein